MVTHLSTQSFLRTHVNRHVCTQSILCTSNISQSLMALLDLLLHWSTFARARARTHARTPHKHAQHSTPRTAHHAQHTTHTRTHARTRAHTRRSPPARPLARDLVIGTAGARGIRAGNSLSLGTNCVPCTRARDVSTDQRNAHMHATCVHGCTDAHARTHARMHARTFAVGHAFFSKIRALSESESAQIGTELFDFTDEELRGPAAPSSSAGSQVEGSA